MPAVLAAAALLKAQGISAEVASFHSIKPLDTGYLNSAAKKFKLLATIEEHGLIGGLGGAVSEWRSSADVRISQISVGTPDEFMHEIGSQDYARAKFGLTAENITKRVVGALQNRQ